VPAPSSRVSTVPAELDQLVARASARYPDDRPRDANELLAEVRRARQMLSPAQLDLRPAGSMGAAAVNMTMALPRTQVVPAVGGQTGAGQAGAGMARSRRGADLLRTAPWQGRRWLVALVALILVAAATTAWYFMAGPGAKTTVPKVAGLTRVVAERALTTAHLSDKVVTSFDETAKAGVVLAADPPAGREVSRGSTVTLTVSQGQERYGVPPLVGRSQAEATQRLKEAKLTLGTVTEAFSETVPQGQVISTSPPANTSVKRATAVALVTSKGRQPITLQDWTGKPADQAVKAMTDAKLKVDATKQDFSTTVPKGYVISQSPPTGTLFQKDSVTLVVSKGPELVLVPSVIGKPEAEATSILQGLGLTVEINRVSSIFGVLTQSISAGTKAPKGSIIRLTVV
jgi:beta-lactam-binding protein with PASTA domain